MRLRAALRWLATTFGGIVLTPFLQAPASKLAEKLHFDSYLSDRWGPFMQWLSDLIQNPSYIFLAGLVAGAPAALWLDYLFREYDRQKRATVLPVLTYVDTRLKLRRDPSGSKSLLQEGQKNIHGWQQTIVGLDFKGENHEKVDGGFLADTLSIAFERAIPYERPTIDTFGHHLEGVSFYPLGSHGAVFQFYGGVPAGAIEIWFPPPGHYAKLDETAQYSLGE